MLLIYIHISNGILCAGGSEEYNRAFNTYAGGLLANIDKILYDLTNIASRLLDEAMSETYYYQMDLIDNQVYLEEDRRFNDYYISGDIVINATQDKKIENSSNNSNTDDSSNNSNPMNPSNIAISCKETYYIPYIDYNYKGKNGIQ